MNFFTEKSEEWQELLKQFQKTKIAKELIAIKIIWELMVIAFAILLVLDIIFDHYFGEKSVIYVGLLCLFEMTNEVILRSTYYKFLKQYADQNSKKTK